MLLLDRGLPVSLEALSDGLMMPSMARDLAACLNSHSPFNWSGGSLREGTVITSGLIAFLTSSCGSWAALLEPDGIETPGHWVVVDGVSPNDLVLVRDPAGSAYAMLFDQFAALWGYTMLVLQQDSP